MSDTLQQYNGDPNIQDTRTKKTQLQEALAHPPELAPHLLSLCHDLLDYTTHLEKKLHDTAQTLSSTLQTNKRLEYALATREEAALQDQSVFLDHVHDAVIIIDANYQICFWNRQAEMQYGWKAFQVVDKKNASIFLSAQEYKRLPSLLSLLDKQAWQGRMQHFGKDKKEVWADCNWSIFKKQKLPFYMLTAANIGPLKQLELEYNRLQRFYAATQMFIESSHDLNNAMVTYMSTTRMIRQHMPATIMNGLFAMSDDAIKKSMNIMKRMLAFGRGQSQEYTTIDLRTLLQELTQLLGMSLPSEITLNLSIGHAPCEIFGHATEVHQALLNLCINAKDAMQETGGVLQLTLLKRRIQKPQTMRPHMETLLPGQYAAITVRDTGHGIKKRHLNTIFTPFFSTKRTGEGTGVGLSSVYRIVKNHNGWIHAVSKSQHGSRFTLYFPLVSHTESRPLYGS